MGEVEEAWAPLSGLRRRRAESVAELSFLVLTTRLHELYTHTHATAGADPWHLSLSHTPVAPLGLHTRASLGSYTLTVTPLPGKYTHYSTHSCHIRPAKTPTGASNTTFAAGPGVPWSSRPSPPRSE